MELPKVAIVILNWNGKPYLRDCLTSVFDQAYPNYELILVDNGSTDGSVEYVRENFPEAKVIANERNLGFAEGNNIGIEEAFRDKEVRYIATLNNDTCVDKHWLTRLIDVIESEGSIGSIQPKVLFSHRPSIVENTGILIFKDGGATNRGINQRDTGCAVEEIFGCCAAAALYRRQALEDVGLFDDIFFAYREDVDLAWRLRLAGWKAVIVPSSVVYHVHSGSVSSSRFKLFLISRNLIFVLVKNLPLRYIPLFPLNYLARRFRSLRRKQDGVETFIEDIGLFQVILIILWSWITSLRYLPALIKRRHSIQKNRRATKREVFSWFERFAPYLGRL